MVSWNKSTLKIGEKYGDPETGGDPKTGGDLEGGNKVILTRYVVKN